MPNVNLKPEDRLYFVQSFAKEGQSVGYSVIQKVGKKYIYLSGRRKVEIETLQDSTESYHNRRQYYVLMGEAKQAIERNEAAVTCNKLLKEAYRLHGHYRSKSLEQIKELITALEKFIQQCEEEHWQAVWRRANDEIDAAYWRFCRCARTKPPVLECPDAYRRRSEAQRNLDRIRKGG